MPCEAVRATEDPEEAERLIVDALPPTIAAVLEPSEFVDLHQRLGELPEPPTARVWAGRLASARSASAFSSSSRRCRWSSRSLFMHDIAPAMRVSDGIAIILLALTGAAFSRMTGRNPWFDGVIAVLLGSALVALTMALGG